MINAGDKKIKSIYCGANKIGKVYQGHDLVYTSQQKEAFLLGGMIINDLLMGIMKGTETQLIVSKDVITEEQKINAVKLANYNGVIIGGPTYAMVYAYTDGDCVYIKADEKAIIYANEDCSYMFSNAIFKTVDLTNMNFKYTVSGSCMFYGMRKVELIKFGNKCEMNALINADFMFNNCQKLKKIENIENFRPRNMSNMRRMFSGDISLEELYLKNWDMPVLSDLSWAFFSCMKLKGDMTICRMGIDARQTFGGNSGSGFACDNDEGFVIYYTDGNYEQANELMNSTDDACSRVRIEAI